MTIKKSLFIQVDSYVPASLAQDLEHVYQEHRNSDEADYIYNVVLTDYVVPGGVHSNLEIIAPYLPGGAKASFDNVFVGLGNIDYPGYNGALPVWQQTSPYAAGILDQDFRWQNLQKQKAAWETFDAWYTGPFHFYIGYEAVLSWWTNDDIAEAYEAYLIQSVLDARNIQTENATLWSPSIWDRWTWLSPAQKAKILSNIDKVFKNIPKWAFGDQLDWLHIQDARGTTASWGEAAVQNEDVQAWVQDIGALDHWASFRVNMEMFKTLPNGGIIPLTPAEFQAREAEYANLNLGASWSLRWWMQGHPEDETNSPPPPAPPQSSNVAPWVAGSPHHLRADNIGYRNRTLVREYLKTGERVGPYAERAAAVDHLASALRSLFPLEVQGDRYMRPYTPNPSTGRATNSDHLTAGALDIFFRTAQDKRSLRAVQALLNGWKQKNIVRYYIDLGANAAHWDHIHVSFQLGIRLVD